MNQYRSARIDELTEKYPNLRNELFRYFDEGCTAALVKEILYKKYQIRISGSTIQNFRQGAWIPYRQTLEQRRINAAAKRAVEQELALRKDRMAKTSGGKR